MDQGFFISYQVAAYLSGFVTVVASLVVWSVKGRLNHTDRAIAEVKDQLGRAIGELTALIKESEARDEGRNREIQAVLREISYRVGRLEGAGGVSAGPAPRTGRHSPRQADEPSGATDSEMVVVTGVPTEPAFAAGQAHQAVPGPGQAAPQGDGTEPEPRTEEPPEPAR